MSDIVGRIKRLKCQWISQAVRRMNDRWTGQSKGLKKQGKFINMHKIHIE